MITSCVINDLRCTYKRTLKHTLRCKQRMERMTLATITHLKLNMV